ncbi:MAG: hypothetical protein DRO88_03090 [Promethearchaeia archaeon]|nr:MAG: hypothetical protein DRO88_03090 [Candidatus Lokiarchaeia archaeon]
MENPINNENSDYSESDKKKSKFRLFKKKKEDQLKSSEEPPKDPTNLQFQEILEKELGIIKVYDYAINYPMDLIFQPKLMEKYKKELIIPLIGEETEPVPETADGGRLFIREEYQRMKVDEKVHDIIGAAEETARQNGVKSHINKQIQQFSIIIMVTSMIAYFIILFAFGQEGSRNWLIPIFLLMCLGPQLMRTLLTKRFEKFRAAHEAKVVESQYENIQEVKIFIQDVIDDVRDRLLTNNVSLEKIQFILFSKGYSNVQFMRNQGGTRGSPLRSVYQFQYPDGMGPQVVHNYGSSGIQEDEENDLFIFIQNAKFNDDGQLVEFQQLIPPKSEYRLPEGLLNVSDFSHVENPSLIIPNFDKFDGIHCECGHKVHLKSMKECRSTLHDNFEFFLIIGEKCTSCGKNPYALFNSPGNANIPGGLKRIFGDN